MMRYNTPITVLRDTVTGEQRIDMKAIVDRDKLFLPVDADIDTGDRVEMTLPNGKTKILYITHTTVLRNPFSSVVDHTEADYVTTPPTTSEPQSPTFNVHATNVQVATGDYSQQTMTVGQTVEELVLVIQGITELLKAAGITEGLEDEVRTLEAEAIAGLQKDKPKDTAVRRFCDWVLEYTRKAGSAASTAAISAAINGLLHDAAELVKATQG